LLELKSSRKLPQLACLSGQLEEYVDLLRVLVSAKSASAITFHETEKTYHVLKSRMLAMIVKGELSPISGERTLDILSSVRRLCDQWHKTLAWRPATDLLNGASQVEGVENPT
ncbi:MAG TPA: hypothetical protein VIN33_05995, partial [Marinobacter sp.]